MKKHFLKIGLTLLIMLLPTAMLAQKVVSWNVYDFDSTLSTDRIEDFQTVLDELQPDILIVQDMVDADAATLFLNKVLNHQKKIYKKAKFTNQDGTQSALFYNKKTIKLFNTVEEITTLSRSVWGYKVKIKKGEGKGKTLYLYSVHLTEGTTAAAKISRDEDTAIIRDYLNNKHKDGDYFLVCGTFNLLGATDAAFKTLTGDAGMNTGRLYDPLDLPGKWFKKKKFADTHTVSTRKAKGMGASGGLMARYDMFFISEGIAEDKKFTYKDGSNIAYGNDGKHFKKAVTIPNNQAVDQDIAEALYRASDHLPLIIELGEPGGGAPMPPSELTAAALSSATVKLDWKDNSDNEDGFHVSRAADCFSCHSNNHCNGCHGGFPGIPNSPIHEMSDHYYSWSQIQTMNTNVNTYTDGGLSGGVTYKYKVRAFNSSGNSAYSNIASAQTATTSTSAKTKEK